MIDFLELLKLDQTAKITCGETAQLQWAWLGEGILQFRPHRDSDTSLVLSAGIHGNETAPIELLAQLCQDLLQDKLTLNVNLLCVLGNPLAIRAGVRYVEYDMNRMFCGAYQQLESVIETQRAEYLEQLLCDFYLSDAKTKRYHLDLHTAIRKSYLEIFALLPFQQRAYDTQLLQAIEAAELDAVVYHQAVGTTFTHFSSSKLQAESVTLELGKAKSFGENNLSDFNAIDLVLRQFVEAKDFSVRKKPVIRHFKVVDSIVKTAEDFQLNLADDAPNFTEFHFGDVIATQNHAAQQAIDYVAHLKSVFILFPNNHVKIGLRAALVLEELELT